MTEKEKEIISKYMSKLGKKAREMHPRPKEYYQWIQKKSAKAQRRIRDEKAKLIK